MLPHEDEHTVPTAGPARTRVVPFPGYDIEFARMVQKALLDLENLLRSYRLATADIDGAWRWMADLRVWREELWPLVAYLASAGWQVPLDIDLDPSPARFIGVWRALLLKVWPEVDPDQLSANHQSVATEH